MTLTGQLWDKSLPLIRPLLIVVKMVVMTPAPAFSRLAEGQAMSKSLAHKVIGISFVNTRKPSAKAILHKVQKPFSQSHTVEPRFRHGLHYPPSGFSA